MGLDSLNDDELDALDKKGLEALSDDALDRLDRAEPPSPIAQAAPAARVPINREVDPTLAPDNPYPAPTPQGVAMAATEPGRQIRKAGGNWARQVPTKFGMEAAPEGSTVEKVGQTVAGVADPLFAAGMALAPEVAGVTLAGRVAGSALQGASGSALVTAFEDMAQKGEIDPKDVGMAALFGGAAGGVLHGATEAGMYLGSKATAAAERVFKALGNRLEYAANDIDYHVARYHGLPTDTGLVPRNVASEYMEGKLTRGQMIAESLRANKDAFAARVAAERTAAGTAVPDEVVAQAAKPMVEAGLPEDVAWAQAQEAVQRAVPPPPEPLETPRAMATAPLDEVRPEPSALAPEVKAAMERTGIDDPELAMALVTPPEGLVTPPQGAQGSVPEPPAVVSDAIEPPADEGDISFMEPSTEPAKNPDAPVYELEPKEIARRFPQADAALQERLLRRVAQAGYQVSPEAIAQFPQLKADMDAKLRESYDTGESDTPGMDLIRRHGGIKIESLEKVKERSEAANLEGRGVLRRKGEIRGWDGAAELLYEAGLIREHDVKLAQELLDNEARKPAAGSGPGAASKKSMEAQKFEPTEVSGSATRSVVGAPADQSALRLPPLRTRPQPFKPEEVAAMVERSGLTVGKEVATIRGINDPVFGKIPKGTKAIVKAIDLEGGQAIIEYKAPGDLMADVAVVPIQALAEPVRVQVPEAKPAEVKPKVKEVTGQTDTSPAISTTEREQLKLVLQAQENGATKARLAVEKKARSDIRDIMRTHAAEGRWNEAEAKLVGEIDKAKAKAAQEQQEAVRKKIANYVKSTVPPNKRWPFLTKIAKAKTMGDLAQAMDAVDKFSNDLFNKGRVKDIQTQVERLLKSPSFPEEVKVMIRDLFKEININNRSNATRDKLVRIQEFVDRLRAQGGDVEIPQALTDRLKSLANRQLNEMEPEEVEAIYTALKRMEILGKGIKEARQILEEAEIDAAMDAFEMQGRKIESPMPTARGQNKASLVWAQKFKNKLIKTMDFANSIGMALRPNQTIVDEFGPEFRRFLMNPLDDAYTNMLTEHGKAVDFLEALVKKHGIPTEQRQDAITTVLMREQGEEGINKLKQLGMTRAEIDAEKLSESERAIADALRGYLNDPARVARLKAVDERIYNQSFTEVPNRWPMKTDYGVKGEPTVRAQGSDVVDILKDAIDARRKNVDVGQLQARKLDAKQIIRRDIFGVFMDDVRQGAIIANMAESLIRAKKIIQDPRFSAATGDVPYDFFNDMIDVLARDGKFPKTKFEVAAAWVKNNLAVSYLWGMPHVGLLQMSMLPNASSIVGGENMAAALRAGPEWEKFVADHMPRIRLIKGGDISVHEVLQGNLLPGLKESGFKGIVAANHYVAERTGIAAYMQYCKEHGIEIDPSKPNDDAIRYAQQVVGKSGATPWLIDMPMGLSRGNITGRKGLDALLLQFQSDQLAKGGLLYEAVAGKAGEGERARRMAWLGASVMYESGVKYAWSAMVAATMYGMGIIGAKEYEKRKEKNKYWKSVALNSLDGVPAMGQASRMISYGSSGVPVLDAGMNLGKALKGQKLVATLGALAAIGGMPLAGISTRLAVAGMKESDAKYKNSPAGRSEARRKRRERARSRR